MFDGIVEFLVAGAVFLWMFVLMLVFLIAWLDDPRLKPIMNSYIERGELYISDTIDGSYEFVMKTIEETF